MRESLANPARRPGMRASLLLVTVTLTACEKPKDPPKDPATRAVVTDAARAAAAIDAAPAPGCALRYEVAVTPDWDRFRVTATATNASAAEVGVTLPDRCPGQPLVLHGLPSGYDPDDACVKGVCNYDEIPPPDYRAIAPGTTVTLATWSIGAARSSCNAALAAGTYDLTFETAPLATKAATCGPDAAALVIAPTKSAAAKPKPPAPTTKTTPTTPAPYHCPRMPACGIGCPGDMAHDEHGCTLCACEPDPLDKLRP